MSEKKRKRQSEGAQAPSHKRVAVESSDQAIKISHIEGEEWTPILGKCCVITPLNLRDTLYRGTASPDHV